jgi:Na+/H+ antiporter NhaC
MKYAFNFIIILIIYTVIPFSSKGEAQKITNIPSGQIEITLPEIIVQHVETEIGISLTDQETIDLFDKITYPVWINGSVYSVKFDNGKAKVPYTFSKKEPLVIRIDDFFFEKIIFPIPLWMSILPPLIAILFALLFREVYSALFFGLLVGTTVICYYQGSHFIIAVFQGLFAIVDTYILESMSNTSHLSIIVFSLMIGAMVSLITKNGGMKGVVNILSRYAKSARSGQFVTWLLGIMIFFDDYANTMVVGNTMRPMTDRLRISREKLAYIVDSTAAPVAAIAFVTTWIGAELSYIQDGINTLGINESAYSVFINSLGYSFYPIFTLLFILMLIFKKVDFGPMVKAEKKARDGHTRLINNEKNGSSNKLNEPEISKSIKARWYNAVIPVLVIIFGTMAGLAYTGWDASVWHDMEIGFSKKISIIIGNSDSYKALLWSSLSGVVVAVILTKSQRIMRLRTCVDSLISGFRTMLAAVLILILAWSLALVTEHMHTADFISQSMLKIALSPYLIPALTFILAALVSFSTGSSWGTMAILYPLLLPASWLIARDYGLDENTTLSIFYNVVSCILAGSVLGDHCSPISDTTILSSLASSCNHIEHVRTQLPYALTVGVIAIIAGTIPSAYGISKLLLYPLGLIVLFAIILLFGKKIPAFKLMPLH